MSEAAVMTGAAEPSLAELKIMLNQNEPEPAAAPAPQPATPETPAEIPSPGGEEPPAGSQGTEAASGTAPESQKTPEPETPVEIPRKPSGLEKRFSKLTREIADANQRAEQAETRLRELEAAGKTPPAEPAKPAASTAAVAGEPVPPDPTGWTGTWEELEAAKIKYSRDIAAFVTKQAREELRAELQREAQAGEGQRVAQQLHASWEAKAEAAAKENPEFQEAVNEVGPVLTRLGMADLVKESEVGPELVAELYGKPEQMEELLKLERQANPLGVSRVLGRIEARLLLVKESAAKPAPKPSAVAAKPLPRPPATPGGGGYASTVPIEDMSIRDIGKLLRH